MPNLSPSKVFQQTRIIYFAMLSGQIGIAAVFLFLNSTSVKEPPHDNMFLIIGAVIFTCSISGSIWYYNKLKRAGTQLKSIDEKVEHFKQSNLVRWALLEGANLILLVFYFLEGQFSYLLLFAVGLVLFVLAMPSINSFRQDYNLKQKEVSALE